MSMSKYNFGYDYHLNPSDLVVIVLSFGARGFEGGSL